jgi:hypothetical protein
LMITHLQKPRELVAPGTCLCRDPIKMGVPSDSCAEPVFHAHFNPRIVETISNYANSRALTDRDYLRFIKREFDNPSKLWEHSFRNDISPVARTTLAILWTFAGTADLEVLKSSVPQTLAPERRDDVAFLFTEALRQLDGNFLLTSPVSACAAEGGPGLRCPISEPVC